MSTPDTPSGRHRAVSAGSPPAAGTALRGLQQCRNAPYAAIAGRPARCAGAGGRSACATRRARLGPTRLVCRPAVLGRSAARTAATRGGVGPPGWGGEPYPEATKGGPPIG